MGILCFVIAIPLASAAKTLPGTHGFLHSTGFAVAADTAVCLAAVFWLGLAFWVYRDVRRRTRDPFLRLLATLLGLAPYIGPVVYLVFRPSETLEDVRSRRVELQVLEQQLARTQPTCPACSTAVAPEYLACPVCTTMLREPCGNCNSPLEPLWQMCPFCATAAGPSQVDLDAALTAETRTIALVQQARAADA